MIQQWFQKTIDNNLKLIIWLCIIIIIFILIWNNLNGVKGTYTNYNDLISDLLSKPVFQRNDYLLNNIQKTNGYESVGEKECRRVIEQITGKPFLKARPSFLKNEITGQCLELDCYNADLGLAIEYNGAQHYQFTPRFHKNKEEFYNLKYRDNLKQNLCKKYGVRLITVPYTVKVSDIELFIRQQFNQKIE